MYFGHRYRVAVYALSLSLAAFLFALMLLRGIYLPSEPYYVPLNQRLNNAFALCLILALTPPAVMEFINDQWLRGVDVYAPRLLMDVTEAVRSGVPLTKALEDASARDYGPISKPLGAAMVRFNLTSDFEGSLKWLGERLIRPVAKRLTTILIEASETGGRIIEVLETGVELFTSLAEYREERDAQMRPYILVVYIGSVVFLIIAWVILVQFLSPLASTSTDPLIAKGGFLQNIPDINYYKSILFWAAVMEALFGGFVAGKIRGGRISAGLTHSVLLLVITIAFFNSFSV